MQTILPAYRHIVNPRLKHTYLSIDDDGTLLIRSPRVSQQYIESLLIRKSDWITEQTKRHQAKKGYLYPLTPKKEIYYFGEPYKLRFIPASKRYASFECDIKEKKFYFRHNEFNPDICKKRLFSFYKEETKRMLSPLIEYWSRQMGLYPESIRFRKAKRQWGSCSASNRLSFNTMLAKVPIEASTYVVVHELAHIKHKHHKKAFWELVERYLPDYKERQRILREYTPL